MALISVEFAQVVEAARAWVAAQAAESPGDSWFYSWAAPAAVARQLGVHDSWARGRTLDEQQAIERFNGQARRAMDRLVAEGVLRKVARGERMPSGNRLGNESAYFTPVAWDAAARRAADERDAAQELSERWARIYDQLAGLNLGALIVPVDNVTRSQARGKPVTLEPSGWEELLGRVKR